MTTTDVAPLTKLSSAELRAGAGPRAHRLGGRIRYLRTEVEAWITANGSES